MQYTIQTIRRYERYRSYRREFKHKDDELKGILLKDILLSHTVFDTSQPKTVKHLLFYLRGDRWLKVLFIRGTSCSIYRGRQPRIYHHGKNWPQGPQHARKPTMTSAMDQKTGRRYLHNLDKIIVGISVQELAHSSLFFFFPHQPPQGVALTKPNQQKNFFFVSFPPTPRRRGGGAFDLSTPPFPLKLWLTIKTVTPKFFKYTFQNSAISLVFIRIRVQCRKWLIH